MTYFCTSAQFCKGQLEMLFLDIQMLLPQEQFFSSREREGRRGKLFNVEITCMGLISRSVYNLVSCSLVVLW